MPSRKVKQRNDDPSGIFIPAGLFLGLALGFIYDNVPVGIFGGLALGFFMFAIAKNFKK